jgi:hypothetical protein
MHRRAGVLAVLVALGGFACSAGSNALDGGAGDAGDSGTGPVWVEEPGIPVREDFFGVFGRARDDVFIVGWNGTILHYDGMAWTKQAVTSTAPITAIHGYVPDDPTQPPGPIFAIGWKGRLLSYQNNMWSDMTATTTNTNDLFGVRVGNRTNAIAVGDHGRVLGWNGRRWRIVPLLVRGAFSNELISPQGVLKGIWNSGDGDQYFISGSGGASYRSSGGFASFELLDTQVSEALRGVWGSPGGGTVYTVGLNGLILRFQNDNWRRVRNNGADKLPAQFFFDIDGTSADDITIVGWGGTAVRFINGAWITEETGTKRDLRAVWIDRTTQVAFAVGADGTVLRRDPRPPDDGGAGVDP